MTDDSFGAFVPGKDCRNVGIDEMKGYYYWPGEVYYIFLELCNHVMPDLICYNANDTKIIAVMEDRNDDYWLRFKRITDAQAKASGLRQFDHTKWIEQLRDDKKNNKNFRDYNK